MNIHDLVRELNENLGMTLELAEGKHVALAWLMGANPRLDEELPVLYIASLLASRAAAAPKAKGIR